MAYTGTIVTEAEQQFMAGENVDATGDVEANHQFLANYAEAYLSTLVEFDIVTAWATITAKTRAMFTEWAARFAGMQLIMFNMAGYTTRQEGEDMVDVHAYRMEKIEAELLKQTKQDFMGVG